MRRTDGRGTHAIWRKSRLVLQGLLPWRPAAMSRADVTRRGSDLPSSPDQHLSVPVVLARIFRATSRPEVTWCR
jgi:hypothetical protein